MSMNICGAPGCWGIEDPNNPNNPHWTKVLSEASIAGYTAIELGPYGYLPVDADVVSKELEKNNLAIVAGTIFQDLLNKDNLKNVLKVVDDICGLITNPKLPSLPVHEGQKFPSPLITIMDWYHDERDITAGHSNIAPRLSDKEWSAFVENVKAVCERANQWGVRPVIHPHAGGYIEFSDEIEKIARDIPYSIAGFCLDTGHLFYSGMDPAEYILKYADRLDYVHFKDINEEIYKDVLSKNMKFFDGCAIGTMCQIGKGNLDYECIRKALEKAKYSGYITIEQERDPKNAKGTLEDVKQSIDYLKNTGYSI